VQLKDGHAIVAAAEKVVEETKAKLHLAESKRTNRDSMVEDVWAKNPKIKEEVMNEIENHEWFKDIK
jgi:negative regulator of genetic competence, sporulation and motility